MQSDPVPLPILPGKTLQRTANIEGVKQVIDAWQAWIVAFPDIHANVLNSFLCEANVVCDETIVSGTHTGPMQTPDEVIPATGKSLNVRSCRIVEIEGERVKSIRHYFDMMTMMQQLGLAGRANALKIDG